MPISPARKVAFDILLRVETEAAFASEFLRSRLDRAVSARDAALATELVMGSLRWQRLLDFFIARYSQTPLTALDAEVLVALRLGVYQLRKLERIPERSAVNESVEMVKRARKKSASGMVNAILRRAAAEKTEPIEPLLPCGIPLAESLGIAHSHPTWLVERWLARFGGARTSALLAANNATPAVACAAIYPDNRAEIIRSLEKEKIVVENGRLVRSAFLVPGGNIARSAAFREGLLILQDEASQLIPFLLGVARGDSVLDLCAAPGGKTIALARAAGPGSLVVASDLHESRLRSMRERLAALSGIAAVVRFVALDGSSPLPFRRKFDRILVDAPCSGTGTLARHPEIRWRLKPEDLADLHQRQLALLSSAIACLAPGGLLLYSTCSLEPEENEQVIAAALAAHPEIQPLPSEIPPGLLAGGISPSELIAGDGILRTFPPEHHADGFFAAALHLK